MTTNHNRTVAIVGLGYVGLPLALLADRKGFKVIGLDNNAEKVKMINNHTAPFADEKISEELQTTRMEATMDATRLEEANIIIVCVPTPVYEDRTPNLEPVKGACQTVAQHLQKGQLVIIESTVNPGVCDETVLPILEKVSGLKCGQDFYLAHCPERINPGDPKWNVENISRVVGAYDEESLRLAVDFYESILQGEVKPMRSLKEAEAVKVVENSFRDINIAFVNELAMSFVKLNIDVVNVIEGASTKPFSFLAHFPGCGVGGHCIPVDPYYLIEYAKGNGFDHAFLRLARQINSQMPRFTVEQVQAALKEHNIDLKDAKVAVLGLAYKGNIDDYRESPALEIIKELEKSGAQVVAYDPHVYDQSTTRNLDEALGFADAVVIATAHQIFKDLTPDQLLTKNVKVVVDGRNCLKKKDFVDSELTYRGIGR